MLIASVVSVLGWIIALFAGTMILPALIAFGFEETALGTSFLGSAGLTFFAGIALIFATRGADPINTKGGGFLTGALAFLALAFFGALPIYLSEAAGPADAYFEALSGLTTSGATIFASLETLPHGLLFWRALLQWTGGLGTIVLAVSILSFGGVGGMNLFSSALAVSSRETLGNRMRDSVLSIWWVYAILTLICAVALLMAGIPTFDALAYAMSTISTGGFNTRDLGFGAFNNPVADYVLIVFMLVAAVNFTLHGALFHGRTRPHRRDIETRYLIAIGLIGALLVFGGVLGKLDLGFGDEIRIALFSTISALTTTGFNILPGVVDSAGTATGSGGAAIGLPVIATVLLIGLMLVGGATGSTAGGVKTMRIIVFIKLAGRELSRLTHPHGVVRLRFGDQAIDEDTLRSVWGFLTIFISTFVLIAIALGLIGFDFEDAIAATVAMLTNTGAGYSLLGGGETFADAPSAAKLVLALGMLLGRLEVVTVLVLFSPSFWRY